MKRLKVCPETRRMVLAAITRAADAGTRCPYNDEIAAMVGAESPATGARIVADLEHMGLIEVERFGAGREVTIVETGSKTFYGDRRNAHWRAGIANRKSPTHIVLRPRADPVPDEQSLPPAVYRDPCPRCGTRRDLGCQHSPTRISMGAFA